jgi:hypothetical protein
VVTVRPSGSVTLVSRPAASYPYVVVLPLASTIVARFPAPSYVYRVETLVVAVPPIAVLHGSARASQAASLWVDPATTRQRRPASSKA